MTEDTSSSTDSPHTDRWLTWLAVGTSLTLFARGWLTWRWDSPIRGLFWQEDWWSPLLENALGIPWSTWAEQSDGWITPLLGILGILLMLSAFAPWLVLRRSSWASGLLWLAFAILLVDSFARWVGADFDLGMGIEHSLQMSMPLAFLYAARNPSPSTRWWVVMAIASAFTFVGHGLYASGFHPVPLSYQTMTTKILGTENPDFVITFLRVAGWLDFAAAIGLFLRPLRTVSLVYMIGWGGATALARTWAHFGGESPLFGLDPWIAETLVRTPHWMLPLLLLWALHRKRDSTAPESS